jgi:hypothetical protein
MVMRNRSEGNESPHWWNDLPSRVRDRISQPARSPATLDRPASAFQEHSIDRGEIAGDLAWIAVGFGLLAVGIVLYLLIAVMFVTG